MTAVGSARTARFGNWSELRHPFGAWVVSRVLGVVGLVVLPNGDGRWLRWSGLTSKDGGWFRTVLEQGYPHGYVPRTPSTWPFYPLYPWLSGAVHTLGVPTAAALVAVSWLAAFAALAGVFVLVRDRFGRRAGVASVWAFALMPGSIGLVMAYSDGLFLAGLVWMLVAVDRVALGKGAVAERVAEVDRLWWMAGAAAAVAAASRPNGAVVLLGAVLAVLCLDRRWMSAVAVLEPAVLFLGLWMLFCYQRTDDPLVFFTAKEAWNERGIVWVVQPLRKNDALTFHVAVAAVTVAVGLPSVRRLPSWWVVVGCVLLAPSLVLGVMGLARYVAIDAPLLVAAVLTADRWPRWLRVVLLVASAVVMVWLANRFTAGRVWVP